jgi:PAS domain S-box-containing protein
METSSNKKFIIPLIVLVISLTLSIILYSIVAKNINKQASEQFQNESDQISTLIRSQVMLYTDALYGAAGLFQASGTVTKEEWKSFTDEINLPQNYTGISSMTYIARVSKATLSSFPYPVYPVANKDEFYAVDYIQPITTLTYKAYGFDLSSEEKRAQALFTARDTDSPTASALVLSITNKAPSFSIYLPVFKKGTVPTTVEGRRTTLTGFVSAGFKVKQLFDGLLSNPIFNQAVKVQIYDTASLSDTSDASLLYETAPPVTKGFITTRSIVVAGRTWTLHFSTDNKYKLSIIEIFTPYGVLGIGIIVSLLLTWIFYAAILSQEEAVRVTKKGTADLEQSQRLFHLSMENAGDMIFIMKPGGVFVDANPLACKTLGYSKEELLTMAMPDIDIVWNEEKLQGLRKELLEKKTITVEGIEKRKDGTTFPVEARVTMFENNGENFSIGIVRDIGERKEAEKKLEERTNDLERLNKLMIGRELKMAELKDKLKNK